MRAAPALPAVINIVPVSGLQAPPMSGVSVMAAEALTETEYPAQPQYEYEPGVAQLLELILRRSAVTGGTAIVAGAAELATATHELPLSE